MVATTGALICSALISLGRFACGHVKQGHYIAGVFNVSEQLGVDQSIKLN